MSENSDNEEVQEPQETKPVPKKRVKVEKTEELEQDEKTEAKPKEKKKLDEIGLKRMETMRTKAAITRENKKKLKSENPDWTKEELDKHFEEKVRPTLNYTGNSKATKEEIEAAMPKNRKRKPVVPKTVDAVNVPKEVEKLEKKYIPKKETPKEAPKVIPPVVRRKKITIENKTIY